MSTADTSDFDDRVHRLHRLLREAPAINAWRERALHRLLSDIGPRIDRLSRRFYCGCGFHYSKLQDFGKLVAALAIHFDPSMNWLEKNEEENLLWVSRQVFVECLIRSVKEAERSADEWAKNH